MKRVSYVSDPPLIGWHRLASALHPVRIASSACNSLFDKRLGRKKSVDTSLDRPWLDLWLYWRSFGTVNGLIFSKLDFFFLSLFKNVSVWMDWSPRLERELACPSQRDRTDGEWVGRGKSDVRCKQRWRRAQLYGKGGGRV